MPPVNWRAKAVSEFGLWEIPSSWTETALKTSRGTQQQWKRYYELRKKLVEQRAEYEQDDVEDDEGETGVWRDVQDSWRGVKSELGIDDEEELTIWKKGLFHTITELCMEDVDEYRTVEVITTMFSPWALPRGIKMRMSSHQRARYASLEFWFDCSFQMTSFTEHKGKGRKIDGDATHVDFREGDEDPDTWETLCSNGYKTPPRTGNSDIDFETWSDVEDIQVSRFIPGTITRLRRWIFIDVARSKGRISDFGLAQLLLLPAKLPYIKIGHTTHPQEQMLEDGFLAADVPSANVEVSWFEHQLRLATQKLRLIDTFYQPYDEKDAHTRWGEQVLDWLECREQRAMWDDLLFNNDVLEEERFIKAKDIWQAAKANALCIVAEDKNEEGEWTLVSSKEARQFYLK